MVAVDQEDIPFAELKVKCLADDGVVYTLVQMSGSRWGCNFQMYGKIVRTMVVVVAVACDNYRVDLGHGRQVRVEISHIELKLHYGGVE